MLCQLFHTCFIAQNRALGALTTRVDGQHSQLSTLLLEYVHTELVDRGTFTCAWYTTDTNADGIATIRQALVDHLLSTGLMVGIHTLNQRNSLREDGDIALEDAFYHLANREFVTTETTTLEVGVNDRGLLYPTVYLQACIF